MLPAKIHFDLSSFNRHLNDVEHDRLPSIIRNALNDTVRDGATDVKKEMDIVFDRPTPYAKRGVIYDKATRENLQAAVVVTGDRTKGGLPATAFLGPQIEGGLRSHKAFERQLIQRGHMLKSEVAVPARETPLDRYGNVTQGFLNRVMADLQIDYRGAGATRVRSDASLKRNTNYQKARYFVPERGRHLHPGVWERKPGTRDIKPVLMFVKSESYTVRLKLLEIVERRAVADLQKNFTRSFIQLTKKRR